MRLLVSPHHPIRESSRLLCYVTDRAQFGAAARDPNILLLEKIRQAAEAGVDWIQIREKALSGAELGVLAREALCLVPAPCRLLINDRLDVACAVGAAGGHLGEMSVSVEDARRFTRERGMARDFLIGVSVHSLDSALAAEAAGADYVNFGPVFATPSKLAFGPPQGLERLAAVCHSVSIPVLAIGGITPENAQECYARGASGIAAIRLFQEAANVTKVVKQLRGLKME
jgi:thiamine-phosphate pyrophosphorylase